MTINNVVEAALYGFTTISAVSALAVALFGSAAALERWLDRPPPGPGRGEVATIAGKLDAPPFDDSSAHTQAA